MRKFLALALALLGLSSGAGAQGITVSASTPGYHKFINGGPFPVGNYLFLGVPTGNALLIDIVNNSGSNLVITQLNLFYSDDPNRAFLSMTPVNCQSNSNNTGSTLNAPINLNFSWQQLTGLTMASGKELFILCSAPGAVNYGFQLTSVTTPASGITAGILLVPSQSTVSTTATIGGGASSGTNVQGIVANGASGTSVLPVSIGGTDVSGILRNVVVDTVGDLEIAVNTAITGDGVNGASPFPLFSNRSGSSALLDAMAYQFNGTTYDRSFICTSTAAVNITTAVTTQIVAVSGSTKIRVCAWYLTNSSAVGVTVLFEYGTGTLCGTGTTSITGAMIFPATAGALALGQANDNGVFRTTASQALCLVTTGATVGVQGYITYAQF